MQQSADDETGTAALQHGKVVWRITSARVSPSHSVQSWTPPRSERIVGESDWRVAAAAFNCDRYLQHPALSHHTLAQTRSVADPWPHNPRWSPWNHPNKAENKVRTPALIMINWRCRTVWNCLKLTCVSWSSIDWTLNESLKSFFVVAVSLKYFLVEFQMKQNNQDWCVFKDSYLKCVHVIVEYFFWVTVRDWLRVSNRSWPGKVSLAANTLWKLHFLGHVGCQN